jgi:hypothetical protein
MMNPRQIDQPKRVVRTAALARAVAAGNIASRNGRPNVTPTPSKLTATDGTVMSSSLL